MISVSFNPARPEVRGCLNQSIRENARKGFFPDSKVMMGFMVTTDSLLGL